MSMLMFRNMTKHGKLQGLRHATVLSCTQQPMHRNCKRRFHYRCSALKRERQGKLGCVLGVHTCVGKDCGIAIMYSKQNECQRLKSTDDGWVDCERWVTDVVV